MTGKPEETERPLKQAVQHCIHTPTLSDQQLDELLNLQQAMVPESDPATQPKSVKTTRLTSVRWLAATAVLVASLATLIFWNTPADYSRDIALEVVENHLKLKPLDVATHSMQGLRGFFTQLDFSPTRSNVLDQQFSLNDSQLLGGRYCSIKGDTAAQIRYQSSTGLATVYQVDYQADRFGYIPDIAQGEAPKTLTAKGLNVSMWVEMGLLMVLVETP